MIRAFLAVELPNDIRTAVGALQQDLKRRLERQLDRHTHVSWVQPASIHLTLKFLGDTDEQLIDPLKTHLAGVLSAHQALSLPLERIGAFPRTNQPRVLWVGPSESWEQGTEAARLAALHRAIEIGCSSFGFAKEERPLSPHLTLARVKDGERQAGAALAQSGLMDRPLSVAALPVEAVALMKSELRPAGAVYTKLWELRLGAAGDGSK